MDVIDNVVKHLLRFRQFPLFVGIDPGSSGALGFVVGEKAFAMSLPTMKIKKKGGNKTEFVLPEIVSTFERLRFCRWRTRVALETPQVMGKGQAFSAMRQGANFGMWPLFLCQIKLSYQLLHPSSWKKAMRVSKDKNSSRLIAMQTFPNLSLPLKKDHDKAEAVLMAVYLRRTIHA